MKSLKIGVLLGLSLLIGQAVAGEFSGLKASDYQPGTRSYLVYMQNNETGAIRMSEIWQRTTEITEQGGKPAVKITQHWTSADERFNRELKSLNRLDDFAPIYHWTKNSRGIAAFTFDDKGVHGDPSVANNLAKDIDVAATELPLNWELDIETFQLLDFAEGKSFQLNFYHPGSKTGPKDYTYQVIGSDTLHLAGLAAIDCWKLKIDYGEGNYAIFWIAKSNKQMLKMEEKWNEFTRFKYLLAS